MPSSDQRISQLKEGKMAMDRTRKPKKAGGKKKAAARKLITLPNDKRYVAEARKASVRRATMWAVR
jgi:hypothetical protein